MIADAIETATAPLLDRIVALERALADEGRQRAELQSLLAKMAESALTYDHTWSRRAHIHATRW